MVAVNPAHIHLARLGHAPYVETHSHLLSVFNALQNALLPNIKYDLWKSPGEVRVDFFSYIFVGLACMLGR